MEIAPGIEASGNVHFGKPVIKNTRVPVELIIGKLASGMSFDDIIKEYEITRQDILAALKYASQLISTEEVKAII